MKEVLKCELCGKMVMILEDGGRRTICCDQLMEKLVEQGGAPGEDSHVPVIEKTKNGIAVNVGGVENPMGEDHYIEWIEVSDGADLSVKWLRPGDVPEARFPGKGIRIKARVYCKTHGLWSNKQSNPKT
jgi:superoxide reductase